MEEDLLPIGQFARLGRLSVKQLRHYDELGLLSPAYVDPDTGYRYYRAAQAREAVSIGLLRSLDVPLPVVGRVLSGAAGALERVRDELEAELARRRRALASLERVMAEGLPAPPVRVVEEPARRVAVVREVVAGPEGIGRATSAAVARLMTAVYGADGPGSPAVARVRLVGTFPLDLGEVVEVAVALVLGEDAVWVGGAGVGEEVLPGGTFACASHVGPYDQIGLTAHAVLAWCGERRLRVRGPVREVYVSDPAVTPPEDLVTLLMIGLEGNASGLGEDEGAVVGDGDGVLGVGGAAAVDAVEGPAVGAGAVAVVAAGDEHGFDGEDEAGAEGEAASGAAVVGDVGVLVHVAADAVSAEVGGDAVGAGGGDGGDGGADVAHAVAGGGGGDAGGEGAFGGVDEVEVVGAWGADGEADGAVAGPAVEVGAEVDAEEVAVLEAVAAGDAVHDGVVDGDAEDGGVGGGGEGWVVAEEGGGGLGFGEGGRGEVVEFGEAGAGGGVAGDGAEGAGDEAAGFAHGLDLTGGFELYHADNYTGISIGVVDSSAWYDPR